MGRAATYFVRQPQSTLVEVDGLVCSEKIVCFQTSLNFPNFIVIGLTCFLLTASIGRFLPSSASSASGTSGLVARRLVKPWQRPQISLRLSRNLSPSILRSQVRWSLAAGHLGRRLRVLDGLPSEVSDLQSCPSSLSCRFRGPRRIGKRQGPMVGSGRPGLLR